jgi:hypothetical protein
VVSGRLLNGGGGRQRRQSTSERALRGGCDRVLRRCEQQVGEERDRRQEGEQHPEGDG